MNHHRILLVVNLLLILGTVGSTVYLSFRNAELESRYAVLAAFVEKMGQEKNNGVAYAEAVQEVKSIQMQLASLQRDFDEWQGKAKFGQINAATAFPSLQGGRKKAPLTVAAIEAVDREQKEQNAIKLHNYFQAEATDSDWSGQSAGLIEKRLANSGDGSMYARLLATECKGTLCRIEIMHENLSQQTEFEFTLPMLFADTLPSTMMFTEEASDGSIRQVVYLARAGHNFP
ncbi:MAG: hypothetical protein PHR16_01720 [Methylovulum sp.]|nr:hypothetical protein [Methylovulum sp.]